MLGSEPIADSALCDAVIAVEVAETAYALTPDARRVFCLEPTLPD